MSTNSAFSGRVMGLDGRVWIVMLVTSLLSLALLGFNRLGQQHCLAASIVVDGKVETGISVRSEGKQVILRLQPYTAKKVTWSFGDGTGKKSGQSVMHQFATANTYRVIAKVEGGCTYEQVVTIQKPLYLSATGQSVIEIFEDPRNPKAGIPVNFYGVTNRATRTYEWKILGGSEPEQFGSVASFTFPYPGSYKVQLKLDNDPSRVVIKSINVGADRPAIDDPSVGGIGDNGLDGGMPPGSFPNPGNNPIFEGGGLNTPATGNQGSDRTQPSNAEAKPAVEAAERAVAVDPNTFSAILKEVIAGNQELDELYRYLDYKSSTKVQIVGKPEVMNIGPFCRQMMQKKEAKIESLEFVKDANNSIQTIKVKVSESRGFFGRLFGRDR